jgi:hypothetical protein
MSGRPSLEDTFGGSCAVRYLMSLMIASLVAVQRNPSSNRSMMRPPFGEAGLA